MDSNQVELEKLSRGDKKRITSAAIDSLLKAALGGTVVTATLLLPGSAIALAPLAEKYLKTLDKRAREREAQRIVNYMRRQELLQNEPKAGNGMVITDKGQKRARKAQIQDLTIPRPAKWDGSWHMVLFDVPQKYKVARDNFTEKLKDLGFYQIQRSVWLYPFPARGVIEQVALYYELSRYIIYLEVEHIDMEADLRAKFQKILPR